MSIAENLYRYLVLSGHLPLPGIGVLKVEKISATRDIAGKAFVSPQYSFSLQEAEDTAQGKISSWLSREMQVADSDAIKLVNDFSEAIRKEIAENKRASWEGVGVFKKKLDGSFTFEPAVLVVPGTGDVTAEKVLHQDASHTMVVGDTEMTSVQMAEMIGATGPVRDYGWIIALILLAASLIFIIYHFAQEGFVPGAVGMHRQLMME